MPGGTALQGQEAAGADALLHRQLDYYQAWVSSLANQAPAPQALALEDVQAALRVVVSGFLDTISAEELRNMFEGLISAHHAAAAPGKAVRSCNIQPGTPSSAVLQLRCSVEASNCLAFDGLAWHGVVLKVQRPRDYNAETAVLLGPTQPNPAVVASVASSSAARAGANGDACSHTGDSSSFVAAVRSAAQPSAHPSRASAPGGAASGAAPAAAAAATASGSAAAAAGAAGAACSKGSGPRDLSLPADQSKQDEVFIGGLPSNWKAQQLKELLAPYGQLKSLSVAMDAATGKNKGYAFVVFASPDMVSHAIEELDCRVVEGKILAVQRATEGKACYGRESSAGGNDTGSLRDGGFVGPQHQHQHQPLPAVPQQHPPLQPHPQPPALHHQHPPPLLRHHHHRSSSTGSALPPHLPAPAAVAADSVAAAAAHAGPTAAGPGPFAGSGHARGSSAGAPAVPGVMMGPAPPPAAPDGGGVLGPRPPPAGLPGSSSGSMQHHSSGPSSAKQYDINELYIGDLPLTWDEDAVRRLLGRFGRIKYFTLRNGRDKNFAFCKFKDSSVVDAAIAGLHGKIVDGYFLNVRRAIEGKQQAAAVQGASPQTQPMWLAGKQPPSMHQQQQAQQQQPQQPNVRASFDATSTRPTGHGHRPRMSADQQQLSKLAAAATAAGPPLPLAPGGASGAPPPAGKGGPAGLLAHPFAGPHGLRGNVLGAGGAAGQQQQQDRSAGVRGEQQQHGQLRGQAGLDGGPAARGPHHHQQQQQAMHLQREQDRAKAGSPPAAGAGAGGGSGGPSKESGGGSTGPSTPGTPTKEQSSAGPGVAEQQLQQQQPLQQRGPVTTTATALPPGPTGPGLPARGYGPFTGPQLLQQPALQLSAHHAQQQQQQQQLQQQLHLQQQQQQQAAMFQAQAGYGSAALPLLPPGPLPPPAQPGGGSAATSLFGPNGPASWPGAASLAAAALAAASPTTVAGNLVLPGAQGGALSMGMGLKQQQQQHEVGVQQGPATQAQSLLQTWDMLSPWSLFSHTTQQ